MNRRNIMNSTNPIFLTILLLVTCVLARAEDRPNIVWILVDDMSSHFGYQGETLVKTPHVDRLAREGFF